MFTDVRVGALVAPALRWGRGRTVRALFEFPAGVTGLALPDGLVSYCETKE
jgi:hypothetical protein